jgi:hypothetical protein
MAGCVFVATLLAIGETVLELRRPFQMDYGEGVVLNSGVRITQGQPLYPDPHAYPLVLNPYGPVGYYLVAACVRLGGVSFVYPRLMILGCGLLVAGLLVLLIQHWTGNWALAWAFGLFFLTTRATLLWWPLLRIDLLAMAISLGGFLVWLRAPRRWWPLAAVLFAVALFVKPTALPAPAACFLSLVAEKQWKRSFAFAGLLGGICLLGMVWMQAWSAGNFFFHVFRSHPDAYTLENLASIFTMTELSFVPLFAFWGAFWVVKGRATRPAQFYLLCSLVLVMLTAGKIGSSINHVLELLAASCIAGALGCQWLATREPRVRLLPVLACIFGAVALYQVTLFAGSPRESEFQYAGCASLYQAVRESPAKKILSENIGALVLAGKPILLAEPFLLAQMVEHGLLPPDGMERRVSTQEFDLVVLDGDPETLRASGSDRWWPKLLDDLNRNYSVTARFDCKDGHVMLQRKPDPRQDGLPGQQDAGSGDPQ